MSQPQYVKKVNDTIESITINEQTYNIGDKVSCIDELGYEIVLKINYFFFDQQENKYKAVVSGNSCTGIIFVDKIKEKKEQKVDLSYFLNKGNHIVVQIEVKGVMTDVIAEVIGYIIRQIDKEVDFYKSIVQYKLSNGETGEIFWYQVKKVHKDAPLTLFPAGRNKKYIVEDDSRYRFKYAKYKAKYLIQKNSLHN